MKRRSFFLLLVSCLCLFFISCVEIVQNISLVNGQYRLQYRVCFSKMLLALADVDPESFTADLMEEFGDQENLPAGVTLFPIETDVDSGFGINMAVDSKNPSLELSPLLPIIKDNSIDIPLLADDEGGSHFDADEFGDNPYGETFLAGAKYRINISKTIVPVISECNVTGPYGFSSPVIFYDMGEMFCIEIPMLYLLEQECNMVEIIK